MSDNMKINLHLWAAKDNYSIEPEPTVIYWELGAKDVK